jgi:hypothetical protein
LDWASIASPATAGGTLVLAGCATLLAEDGVIYLTMSLRSVGRGIGVVHGWRFYPEYHTGLSDPDIYEFHPQNRDIYRPAGPAAHDRARH